MSDGEDSSKLLVQLGVGWERVGVESEFTGLMLIRSLDGEHGCRRKERRRRR
jgi:hypothetical protein